MMILNIAFDNRYQNLWWTAASITSHAHPLLILFLSSAINIDNRSLVQRCSISGQQQHNPPTLSIVRLQIPHQILFSPQFIN